MDSSWQDEAACLSKPGEADIWDKENGKAAIDRLNRFIEEHCYVCPVAQQCLDSAVTYGDENAIVDDGWWTVRGGYLPTDLTSRTSVSGRPKGAKNKKYVPNPPPKIPKGTPPKGVTILEWGVCRSGRHGILSRDDIVIKSATSTSCRGCDQLSRQGVKDPEEGKPATHCKNGHEYSGDNLIQYGNRERRCRTCKRINDRNSRSGHVGRQSAKMGA